jgi:predicted DNA-binding protein (MmcQ/YjbR family)
MRLGQLARQLEIKPEKIVSFLEKEKQLTIKSHPNSKVEDDLIETITAHFKSVEDGVEIVKETEIVAEKIAKKELKTKVEEAPVENKEPEHIETVKPTAPQELKIVGKIDLPNKKEINIEVDGVVYDQETLDNKKKEELKAERERKALEKEEKRKKDEERKKKAAEQRKVEQERQAMLVTEKHNLLSKEEEKKKAIILKAQQERERKLEEKRKARQSAHYNKKHTTTSASPKKKKKKPEIIVEEIEQKIEETVKLNGFQKFIKWLNS